MSRFRFDDAGVLPFRMPDVFPDALAALAEIPAYSIVRCYGRLWGVTVTSAAPGQLVAISTMGVLAGVEVPRVGGEPLITERGAMPNATLTTICPDLELATLRAGEIGVPVPGVVIDVWEDGFSWIVDNMQSSTPGEGGGSPVDIPAYLAALAAMDGAENDVVAYGPEGMPKTLATSGTGREILAAETAAEAREIIGAQGAIAPNTYATPTNVAEMRDELRGDAPSDLSDMGKIAAAIELDPNFAETIRLLIDARQAGAPALTALSNTSPSALGLSIISALSDEAIRTLIGAAADIPDGTYATVDFVESKVTELLGGITDPQLNSILEVATRVLAGEDMAATLAAAIALKQDASPALDLLAAIEPKPTGLAILGCELPVQVIEAMGWAQGFEYTFSKESNLDPTSTRRFELLGKTTAFDPDGAEGPQPAVAFGSNIIISDFMRNALEADNLDLFKEYLDITSKGAAFGIDWCFADLANMPVVEDNLNAYWGENVPDIQVRDGQAVLNKSDGKLYAYRKPNSQTSGYELLELAGGTGGGDGSLDAQVLKDIAATQPDLDALGVDDTGFFVTSSKPKEVQVPYDFNEDGTIDPDEYYMDIERDQDGNPVYEKKTRFQRLSSEMSFFLSLESTEDMRIVIGAAARDQSVTFNSGDGGLKPAGAANPYAVPWASNYGGAVGANMVWSLADPTWIGFSDSFDMYIEAKVGMINGNQNQDYIYLEWQSRQTSSDLWTDTDYTLSIGGSRTGNSAFLRTHIAPVHENLRFRVVVRSYGPNAVSIDGAFVRLHRLPINY